MWITGTFYFSLNINILLLHPPLEIPSFTFQIYSQLIRSSWNLEHKLISKGSSYQGDFRKKSVEVSPFFHSPLLALPLDQPRWTGRPAVIIIHPKIKSELGAKGTERSRCWATSMNPLLWVAGWGPGQNHLCVLATQSLLPTGLRQVSQAASSNCSSSMQMNWFYRLQEVCLSSEIGSAFIIHRYLDRGSIFSGHLDIISTQTLNWDTEQGLLKHQGRRAQVETIKVKADY